MEVQYIGDHFNLPQNLPLACGTKLMGLVRRSQLGRPQNKPSEQRGHIRGYIGPKKDRPKR